MKNLLATTALALTLATPVMADTSSTTAQEQFQEMGINASNLIDMRLYMPNDIAEESDGTTDTATTADMDSEVTEVPEYWRMVGDINDLVVTRDGEVRALLVDAGGFLGIGETDREISIDNVRFVPDADDEGEFFVVYTGDPLTFEEQRSYDPTIAENDGMMRASENDDMAAMIEDVRQRKTEALDWTAVTTEDVLGVAVYGSENEWIGDLSELKLGEDGSIEGAIIDVGGFLGLGEKPVEMPLDQVDIRRSEMGDIRAYVSATEAELEGMPEWRDADS
ncbi:MAG: PRC-barrel domain-containing protein [Paracoccaceae bacterium]